MNLLHLPVVETYTDWPDHLPSAKLAYGTRYNSIKMSPFEILLGQREWLPVDCKLKTNLADVSDLEDLQ